MAYCGPRGIPHSVFLDWDIDDQAKALGWMAEENQRCNTCGTAPWEWERDVNAFDAVTQMCLGCAAVENAQKDNAELLNSVPGMKTFLKKDPEVDRG